MQRWLLCPASLAAYSAESEFFFFSSFDASSRLLNTDVLAIPSHFPSRRQPKICLFFYVKQVSTATHRIEVSTVYVCGSQECCQLLTDSSLIIYISCIKSIRKKMLGVSSLPSTAACSISPLNSWPDYFAELTLKFQRGIVLVSDENLS